MKLTPCLTLVFAVAACRDSVAPSKSQPSNIKVIAEGADPLALHLGQTIQLQAHRVDGAAAPIANDTVQFFWLSSDTTVVTVSQSGQATIVGLGIADVSARVRDTRLVSAPLSSDDGVGTVAVKGTYTVVDAGPVISAAMGAQHECIVREGGEAFCRGRNVEGQLGHGDLAVSSDWVSVIGGHTFASISTGEWHTCGLTSDHQAYCWGRGTHGELGNGRRTPLSSATPLLVTGGHEWSFLDVGGHGATCGITLTDNVPYCFGHDDMGQTGREPIISNDTVVAPISGAHTMSAIWTEHGLTCGLEVTGAVYCSGQWGEQTNTTSVGTTSFGTGIPQRIGGAVILERISIGNSHGCGLTSDGAAWCWGRGSEGQAGTGNYESSGTLRHVVDAPAFRSIHALGNSSCGITAGGEAWCWGSNGEFELGRSDKTMKTNRPVRVKIDTPLKWIQNGDDMSHETYAITESGQLIRWGVD
ncbi:MAG TPA: hypothetical protein VM166_08355 [Gemmatimonadaceae bacterium]|nr:hypothetical protein [Gemmatimonadaceae bacterium]